MLSDSKRFPINKRVECLHMCVYILDRYILIIQKWGALSVLSGHYLGIHFMDHLALDYRLGYRRNVNGSMVTYYNETMIMCYSLYAVKDTTQALI